MDAEQAHGLALRALRCGLAGRDTTPDDPALAITVLGPAVRQSRSASPPGSTRTPWPSQPLMRLGFGFVETGTVTPRPQAGNPRPRLFRLAQDRAVINRLGFNNAGIDAYLPQPRSASRRARRRWAPMSASTRTAPIRSATIPRWSPRSRRYADYVVINVSSPNTPGLRDLQGEARLRAILRAVAERCRARPPLLVKIAPDLSEDGLAAVVETCVAEGVQGLIVSNTTISRPPGLRSPNARQAGGLSGAPLFALSTAHAGPRVPAGARPAGADRRRRRRHRGRRADQDPRRRLAGAALHRLRLCRARR